MKVNLKLLKKADYCKATDKNRKYLYNVFVRYNEDDTVTYLASNGHVLYRAIEKLEETPEEAEKEYFKKGVLFNYEWQKVKDRDIVSLELYKGEEGYVKIIMKDIDKRIITVEQPICDLDFPNIEGVIPADITEDNKRFLDNRMTVFSWKNQLIMEKLGFYWENMIHYNIGTDFQPARFDINNKKEGIQETFVMMPCRTFWENYGYNN
ncbi:hypothetical protein [uncultured Clostridium sp.]|uniref:hypothetical protein n=1 Tax=uncultured Clostridium sp. TaxID=59620 RepID=UPI0025CCBDE7|nr:hypothetical protein [uncultured Clostridium sp.]